MKRLTNGMLVLCVFVVLLVIFAGTLRTTPAGVFFGALAGTPLLVHAFNRLVPRRKEPDYAPEPVSRTVAGQSAKQIARMEMSDRRA